MQRKKTVLHVDGLSVRRGSTLILDNIHWTVAAREHWVILGPNGSGKTSLLSALTGYLMPSGGRIEVLGHRYGQSDWRELRKQIGIVSSSVRQMMADTEPALETIVSGKHAMIDFWGKLEPGDKRRARQILRQIECEYLEDRPWRFLSQGERQRILIGRALMPKPALLILDEPCAGLDPVAREHFLQFLRRLAAVPRAPTLVLVTHHVEEIVPEFSHVLLLNSGRVVGAGRKEDVLTSGALSKAFATPIRLANHRGAYRLSVLRSEKGVTI